MADATIPQARRKPGRPPQKEGALSVKILLAISPVDAAKIDWVASDLSTHRSAVIRTAIHNYLDALKSIIDTQEKSAKVQRCDPK